MRTPLSVLVALSLAGCGSSTQPTERPLVSVAGTWGGNGVVMTLTDAGSRDQSLMPVSGHGTEDGVPMTYAGTRAGTAVTLHPTSVLPPGRPAGYYVRGQVRGDTLVALFGSDASIAWAEARLVRSH